MGESLAAKRNLLCPWATYRRAGFSRGGSMFVTSLALRRSVRAVRWTAATVLGVVRIALTLTAFGASHLHGQQQGPLPALDSGATVRLYLRSGARVTGKLIAPFGSDSTRFRYCLYPAPPCMSGDHRYAEQPAGDVTSVQLRRGTRAIPGVAVGSVVGVGFGFGLVGLGQSLGEHTYSSSTKAKIVTLSTFMWAGLGLMVGAGIDKWKHVP